MYAGVPADVTVVLYVSGKKFARKAHMFAQGKHSSNMYLALLLVGCFPVPP